MNPDAWARIRTWEPLREGILSPSPLTRLGYPRPGRERRPVPNPLPSGRGTEVYARRLLPRGDLRSVAGDDHGPILHDGVRRGARGPPERGCRLDEEGGEHHREARPAVCGPQAVLPARHPGREGQCVGGRSRRPGGLPVRGELERLVDPRARGEGLPVPRHGRQAPVPRIDAEDHGDHGPDEPDHGPRPADAERILKGAGPRCEGPRPSSPGEPLLAPRIDDLTESFPDRRESRRPPEVLPESRVRRARGGVQERDGGSAPGNPRGPQGGPP